MVRQYIIRSPIQSGPVMQKLLHHPASQVTSVSIDRESRAGIHVTKINNPSEPGIRRTLVVLEAIFMNQSYGKLYRCTGRTASVVARPVLRECWQAFRNTTSTTTSTAAR
ncbi:hypothetical protein E2C01_079863 [Portunus trituberculatus]|uniref:Uncharacterized protein n=1 Tax=Portunus trituberculatus TaxID=210409 RepID=A0A5B7IY29_PORTR|nr:hypothetical protein [Portunus trituberculatus]